MYDFHIQSFKLCHKGGTVTEFEGSTLSDVQTVFPDFNRVSHNRDQIYNYPLFFPVPVIKISEVYLVNLVSFNHPP